MYKIDQYGNDYNISFFDTNWSLDWTTQDTQTPASGMNLLSPLVPYQFNVSWWGQDNSSGVLNYDVQYMDGSGGTWTNWHIGDPSTSATFTGIGGHTYYFRLRARDKAFNLGTWPSNPQVYTTVESNPPFSRVNHLVPLIRGNQATLTWGGDDIGGSGIVSYDIQVLDEANGAWENWLSGTMTTTATFSGELGHAYHFRSRGKDNAFNIESWPDGEGDASTSFYSWRTMGTVSDNTGIPIAGADVSVNPTAFLSYPSDIEGLYSAYLGDNPPEKTVTWSKGGYGALPPTRFGEVDGNLDVYLPPSDNQVEDWGFESGNFPGAWQVGGSFTPTLDGVFYHSGDYAASLGISSLFGVPVPMGSLSSTSDAYEPFALDELGGLHISWPSYDGGYKIYYAYRSPTGTWYPTELVAQPENIVPILRIVVDQNQLVHMLYTKEYYPTVVYYTWRDTDGSWSVPQQLSMGDYLDDMLIDNAGRIHALVWEGQSLVYAYHDPGEAWTFEIVPGTEWIIKPAMAVDSLGKVHLVWTRNDYSYNSSKVYYTLRQADGSWTIPSAIAKTEESYSIDIILDSAELPQVVWMSTQIGIYYTHLNPDGKWESPYDFSGGTQANKFELMMDNQDNMSVLWNDAGGYTGKEGVYYARRDHRGIWTDTLKISHPDTYPSAVEADLSGGDIYAVWEESDGTQTDLFFSCRHAGIWSTPLQLTNDPDYSGIVGIEVDALGGINIAYSWDNGGPFSILGTLPITESGEAWVSQSLTVPVSMTHPTLSFLATLSGVSESSGNEFNLLVSTDENTTTLFTSTIPTTWEKFWFDMSPWSGQEITLTYQLTENAGYPPASALLDEVTLGAAHPDVWVEISGEPWVAHPGEQFTYQMEFGNRGNVTASSVGITMTLPVGLSFVYSSVMPEILNSQIVWLFGDIPPGSGSDTIFVSVQVDASAPLFQTAMTDIAISTSSPELEVMNNTDQASTYLGILQHLPILRR